MTSQAYFGEMVTLFDGQQDDGDSIYFEYLHGTKPANLFITGELGGASIAIMGLAPNAALVPLDGLTVTEPGMYVIQTGAFSGRLRLSSATETTFVQAYIRGSVREAEL